MGRRVFSREFKLEAVRLLDLFARRVVGWAMGSLRTIAEGNRPLRQPDSVRTFLLYARAMNLPVVSARALGIRLRICPLHADAGVRFLSTCLPGNRF